MDDTKKVAYCLAAAGGVITKDGYHLLYSNSDNKLVEELWDGTDLKQDDGEKWTVGEDIKPNAPAAYIWAAPANDDEGIERYVFSIDVNGKLVCFSWSDDYGEWIDVALGGEAADAKVHPQTGLAGDVSSEGPILFFVNEDCRISTLVKGDSEESDDWVLGPVLPGRPRVGSPLSTTPGDKGLLLFYIGEDNQMHYVVEDPESGEWQDSPVDGISTDKSVKRFKATYSPTNNTFDGFFLSDDGTLFRCTGQGHEEEIGKLEGRELIKNNAAQCALRVDYFCYSYRVEVVHVRVRYRSVVWCC